jgi:hypothetical protein
LSRIARRHVATIFLGAGTVAAGVILAFVMLHAMAD